MSELIWDRMKEQNICSPNPDMQDQHRSVVVIFYYLNP